MSAGSTTYVVQKEFSNLQNDCVSAPPVFKMTSPTGGVGPSLPFNMTLTIQSSVSPFTLTGYTGTVHFTSSDAQAILPADYTFLPGDSGSHVFSFTLKTLGDQTITVTDTHSAGFTGTATINVNSTPDLAITKSHTGNFAVGQTGATYTITVSNSGGADTSALITVNDALPAGLTATDLSGTNWNCTLSPLQCTRGDVLFAGTSFEPITLTVNVAANAPSSVTNTATVSGGAESNTANDSASDVTQIDAALLMSAQTANLTVAAGSTATTTLNVNYNGSLGAVTFACSGLPGASTCTFNPPSVSTAGTTPVTLSIATTARSSAIPQPNGVPPQFTLLLGLMGLIALALALTRTKNAKVRLATASVGLVLLLTAGCGVSNTPAPGPTPTPGPKGLGTPAGTSAVVVTATSASQGATATSTVNLTVQ